MLTTPSMASEWPTRYFVAALTERSTPKSSGLKKKGVAQVLSIPVVTPRSRATAVIAGISCISMVWEPGASSQIRLVLPRIRSAMPAPIAGS